MSKFLPLLRSGWHASRRCSFAEGDPVCLTTFLRTTTHTADSWPHLRLERRLSGPSGCVGVRESGSCWVGVGQWRTGKAHRSASNRPLVGSRGRREGRSSQRAEPARAGDCNLSRGSKRYGVVCNSQRARRHDRLPGGSPEGGMVGEREPFAGEYANPRLPVPAFHGTDVHDAAIARTGTMAQMLGLIGMYGVV